MTTGVDRRGTRGAGSCCNALGLCSSGLLGVGVVLQIRDLVTYSKGLEACVLAAVERKSELAEDLVGVRYGFA